MSVIKCNSTKADSSYNNDNNTFYYIYYKWFSEYSKTLYIKTSRQRITSDKE